MKTKPLLGLLTCIIVFPSLVSLSAMAQQTTNIIITNGSGVGQLCVAARNCFYPLVSRIVVGTTVTWKNNDEYSHTVTNGSPYDSKVGDKFDSSIIAPGKEFTFTFKDTGTYHYFCEIHPWMKGEIDVIT